MLVTMIVSLSFLIFVTSCSKIPEVKIIDSADTLDINDTHVILSKGLYIKIKERLIECQHK